MRKVLDYVKENKKIIIVVLLIAILIGAVYFINKSAKLSDVSKTDTQKSVTEVKLIGILSSIEEIGRAHV